MYILNNYVKFIPVDTIIEIKNPFLNFDSSNKSCSNSALDISVLQVSCTLIPPFVFSWERYLEDASVTILTALSLLWVLHG